MPTGVNAEGGVCPEGAFSADIYDFQKASLPTSGGSVINLRLKYP
jgi:hypothetical protein